nr:hypothetical protein [Halomonas qijiaojingensis]
MALIQALKEIAATRGAYVVFVQADHGDDLANCPLLQARRA